MSTLSTFYSLPDGAKLAYEILSADKLGLPGIVPLALVNGLNSLGQDFQRLSESLAKSRPGSYVAMIHPCLGLGIRITEP